MHCRNQLIGLMVHFTAYGDSSLSLLIMFTSLRNKVAGVDEYEAPWVSKRSIRSRFPWYESGCPLLRLLSMCELTTKWGPRPRPGNNCMNPNGEGEKQEYGGTYGGGSAVKERLTTRGARRSAPSAPQPTIREP